MAVHSTARRPRRLLALTLTVLAGAAGALAVGTSLGGAATAASDGTPVTLADGATYTLASALGGKCLDVPGAATTRGLQLQQWGCTSGSAWQQFRAAAGGTGYTFTSLSSGQCVDEYGGRRTSGTAVIQWPCTGVAWQHWAPVVNGGGVSLRNVGTGLCLAPTGTGSGAETVAVTCVDGSTTQRWTLTDISTGNSTGNSSGNSSGSTSTPVGGPVIRVAADGSGDVTTLQAAIDRLPNGGGTAYTLLLAKGRYAGQVNAPATKQDYTIRGETGTAGDVVITAGASSKAVGSLTGSSTLTLRGKNVTVRDLTVENTFDESTVPGGSQAIAVYAAGDRQVFRNVRMLGNQDTFFADSGNTVPANRVYVTDSYIAGDVDFVFGSSVIVIDRSTVHELARGGAIAAPSTRAASPYGILITNSTLSSDAAANSTALGRPWHPSSAGTGVRSAMVVRDSVLSNHIKVAQPWWDMSSTSWTTERFFEYNNSGPGATVNGNRPQLAASQAARYTPTTYLAGSDGWNPTS